MRRFFLFFLVLQIGYLGSNGQKVCFQDYSQEKTIVYYSVFIQSFYDSDGDGIGDIKGLVQKLDYLADLGIGGLWLLPIHPSPSYHKYDVADYKGIHPDYGSMEDFKLLVNECHKRGMKIVIDLVLNHTSSEHPWFKQAMNDPYGKYRDYYVWSDDPKVWEKEEFHWHDVGKIDSDIESNEKFYGFFWHEMPDLNYDNPDVRKDVFDIASYWLKEMKIDGFRLDAIRYIYPEKEIEKNLLWWNEFRDSIDAYSNEKPFLFAEIWAESDYIVPFLNSGITAAFNFDLAFSIQKSLKKEKSLGLIQDHISRLKMFDEKAIGFRDAVFLSNHDMNRIRSELNGDVQKSRLAAVILLSLPGNPFIYYGEEIGMLGKKPDEQIREPFLWYEHSVGKGQTNWEPYVYSGPEHIDALELQKNDPESIFRLYQSLIQLRNTENAFNQGDLCVISSGSRRVVAFARRYEQEEILVYANISSKTVVINLPSDFEDYQVVLTSSDQKPGFKMKPYSWFILKKKQNP